jgi:hypothetical protein
MKKISFGQGWTLQYRLEQTFYCHNDHIPFCQYLLFLILLLPWCNSPTRVTAASLLRFLCHAQWHTTVGRIPLDWWSARRRTLYPTTHTFARDRIPCPRFASIYRPNDRTASLSFFMFGLLGVEPHIFLICAIPCIFSYDCNHSTNKCTIILYYIYIPCLHVSTLSGHHQGIKIHQRF